MAAAHCEAVIAYLTAFAKAASPEKAASEKARQFEGLLDSFKQTDLEPGAATELLALLEQQTVFGPDQVQCLAEALADTAPESPRDKPTCKSKKDRRPLQDYSYVFRYCTPDLWTALQDPGLRDFKKLDLLAAHCAKLGLRCPSEFTAQVVTWYFLLYGSDHVPARRRGRSPAVPVRQVGSAEARSRSTNCYEHAAASEGPAAESFRFGPGLVQSLLQQGSARNSTLRGHRSENERAGRACPGK